MANREKLLAEKAQFIEEKINQDPKNLLTKEVFFVLLNQPLIRERFNKQISQLIAEQLVTPHTFFNNLNSFYFGFSNSSLSYENLLADKERTIRKNSATVEEYYSYSSIRLYELAKKLELPEAEHIRDAARIYSASLNMQQARIYNKPFHIIFDIHQVKKETIIKPKPGVTTNNHQPHNNRQIQSEPLRSPPSLYEVFARKLGEEKIMKDSIFTKALRNTRIRPGKSIENDLTAIYSFYQEKIKDTRYSSRQVKRELDLFYKDALNIRLSNRPSKQQIIDSAHKHFQHRDSKARILADALMVISSFFGVGLLVVVGRVLSGRTLFFSTAPTARETELSNSLQMGSK